MLPSCSGILAETISTKILTKNHPDSSHSHTDSPHSHHLDYPRSHPDFSRSYPDYPRFHPNYQRSHHSPHSVPQFPIPAFTDSLKLPSSKVLLISLTSSKSILAQKSKYLNSIRVLPFFLSFFCWNEINKKSSREDTRKIRRSRLSLQLYQKRDFAAGVSLSILQPFLTELTPPVATSKTWKIAKSILLQINILTQVT